MQRVGITRKTVTNVALAGAIIFLWPLMALAADNYFVPVSGGFWNAPGDWSLGHCPAQTEDVHIVVSGAGHKAVYYNWSGISNYNSVEVDGDGSLYGAIWHLEYALTTADMFLGNDGEAWHWMEGPAYLSVDDHLYVGYDDPGEAHFYMAVASDPSAGLYVDNLCYVGYQGAGDFDHVSGFADVKHLYVGQGAPGTYWLKGTEAGSKLDVEYHAVIGNGDEGTFEQTGGTFTQGETTSTGVILGLNSGGVGTYNMRGGTLNCDHISIAWHGDGYFNQTGGVINVDNNVVIGCEGTHPYRGWFKLSDDDDEPTLNIGGDLLVGPQTLAKYEQLGSGTVNVDGNIEIWKGTTDPYSSSYLYMGLDADWLGAAAVTNHDGYFDQDGGTLNTTTFTNDSTQGINLDNDADCRARYLYNNAGTVWMWRNALLRGPYAGGSYWWICDFTNDATFQMGSVAADGGEFRGILTNNGTFDYYQGDFSTSSLINNGTFNCNSPFTCYRFVQNAYSYTVMPGLPITADGGGYANAVENNANFTIRPGASVTVTDAPFVNNDNLYGAGSIIGDLVNNDYLLPAYSSATGELYVDGDYAQAGSADLRIRLGGTTAVSEFDRLRVTGAATLAGELDVRLTAEFTPSLGDSFTVMRYASRTGSFNPVSLPELAEGLEWNVQYNTTGLMLVVVESGTYEVGDVNCDGLINAFDIDPFVMALGDPAGYAAAFPDCDIMLADANGDGLINAFDIDPFVVLLSGG